MDHPELEKLFSCLMKYVKQMLRQYGEVMPLSVITTPNDEVEFIGIRDEDEQRSIEAENLIEMLIGEFQERARVGGIVAAGICADVLFVPPEDEDEEPIDAVRFHLEHLFGETYTVYLPYFWGMHDYLDFGDLYIFDGEPTIFDFQEVG